MHLLSESIEQVESIYEIVERFFPLPINSPNENPRPHTAEEHVPDLAKSSQERAPLPFVPPTQIIETTFAFAQSCALLAAVELNICTWIARGFNTSSQLAERIGATEPALVRLLDTLCALNYLRKTASGYELTPLSERYLYATEIPIWAMSHCKRGKSGMHRIHLSEIVRTGQPARIINEEPLGRFFAPLADYLFPIVYPLMRRICQRLEVGTHFHGLQVLDLGAGTAPSAIAVLEQDADAHATAIDFAPVLERTPAFWCPRRGFCRPCARRCRDNSGPPATAPRSCSNQ